MISTVLTSDLCNWMLVSECDFFYHEY